MDHIAITCRGVWVIDAKRYKGRPELKIEAGILRPRVEKLLVGRRDCTKLIERVLKQVALVRDLVGDVPVTGALCFVEADWPLIGGAFATHGAGTLPLLLYLRHCEKHLCCSKTSRRACVHRLTTESSER